MRQLTFLATLLMAVMFVACGDKPAKTDQLPQEIQSFVEQNFPDLTIASAEQELAVGGRTYELVLSNGTLIEFDTKNEWEKIDAITNPLPASIIPAPIASHVAANYPGTTIVEIDKELYGYDVRLSNNMELEYDKKGAFRKVEP